MDLWPLTPWKVSSRLCDYLGIKAEMFHNLHISLCVSDGPHAILRDLKVHANVRRKDLGGSSRALGPPLLYLCLPITCMLEIVSKS